VWPREGTNEFMSSPESTPEPIGNQAAFRGSTSLSIPTRSAISRSYAF
jgi:hypothetical protein